MLIEYHFGPDAVPQASPYNTDYRTPYGDSIFHWPFYLNMMMNRRDRGAPYGSTFIFGPNNNQVQPEADLLVTQASAVNLAISSSFNNATRVLTANVEAYYTANSAAPLNYLQIAITEDSLISAQYDGSYPLNSHHNYTFNHTNVFRANMNGFWGDTVSTTSSGSLVSRTYTITFPTTPYKWNPDHCKLTLYMTEEKSSSGVQSFAGKVITAVRAKVGKSSVNSVEEISAAENILVYPNPSSGIIHVKKFQHENYRVEVSDLAGQVVYASEPLQENESEIDLRDAKAGVYFVKIYQSGGVSVHKILRAD
jgi:hypothetical protein